MKIVAVNLVSCVSLSVSQKTNSQGDPTKTGLFWLSANDPSWNTPNGS